MTERIRADKHHILFNRQEWTLRPDGERLRETKSLMPLMDRDVHNELHRNVPTVPLLGHVALYRVARDFKPTGDTFESMDRLMSAIEAAGRNPKSHPFEREIGALTVRAIDMQRPYIKEGIING